jgi:hypothetical protein
MEANKLERLSLDKFCRKHLWFPYMFCKFYLVKNHTIVKNLTTTKAKEKGGTESLEQNAISAKRH